MNRSNRLSTFFWVGEIVVITGAFLFLLLFLVLLNFIALEVTNFTLDLTLLKHRSIEEFKSWFPRFYAILFFVTRHHIVFLAFGSLILLTLNFLILRELWKAIKTFLSGSARKERYYSLGMFFIFLFVAEIALRSVGFKPGSINKNLYFTQVKELEVFDAFIGDSTGNVRVSPNAINVVNSQAKTALESLPNIDFSTLQRQIDSEPYHLIYDWQRFLFQDEIKCDLKTKWNDLNKRDTSTYNEWELAIWQYLNSPFNQDGFRSIPFQPHDGPLKKVLLLGDSFVYGHSARPVYLGFSDHLLSKNLLVYNTGISGTDPAHYLGIARELIPKLKPDIVIVNIYLGNDILYYQKELKSGYPAFYVTNAGNLNVNNFGVYFDDPKEIYNMSRRLHKTNALQSMNRLLSKTVIGTRLVNLFSLSTPIAGSSKALSEEDYLLSESLKLSYPNANDKCAEIKAIAEAHESKFILSIIPSIKGKKLTRVSEYPNLFTEMEYVEHPYLTIRDYRIPDGHFNNEGHLKYADHLYRLIMEEE